MKFSTRLSGAVTSVNVPNQLIALYCVLANKEGKDNYTFILDAINDISKQWAEDSGKGFSKFVLASLCASLVPDGQEATYNTIVDSLPNNEA